jgi:hypothetical protein
LNKNWKSLIFVLTPQSPADGLRPRSSRLTRRG